MYAANPSLTFVHFLCWFFLALFDFFFYLRIIRTRGRSEGENLSNIRLEIKYIILGIDHFGPVIFEMIKHNKFIETLKRKRNQTACWSVLTPYDAFYLGNIFWVMSRHALN
jgi:hypothetical protein